MEDGNKTEEEEKREIERGGQDRRRHRAIGTNEKVRRRCAL